MAVRLPSMLKGCAPPPFQRSFSLSSPYTAAARLCALLTARGSCCRPASARPVAMLRHAWRRYAPLCEATLRYRGALMPPDCSTAPDAVRMGLKPVLPLFGLVRLLSLVRGSLLAFAHRGETARPHRSELEGALRSCA